MRIVVLGNVVKASVVAAILATNCTSPIAVEYVDDDHLARKVELVGGTDLKALFPTQRLDPPLKQEIVVWRYPAYAWLGPPQKKALFVQHLRTIVVQKDAEIFGISHTRA